MNQSKKRINLITLLLIFIFVVSFRILISREKNLYVEGKVNCSDADGNECHGCKARCVIFLAGNRNTTEVTYVDGQFNLKLPQSKLNEKGTFVLTGRSRNPISVSKIIANGMKLSPWSDGTFFECDKLHLDFVSAANLKELIKSGHSSGEKHNNDTTFLALLAMIADLSDKNSSSPGDQNFINNPIPASGGMSMIYSGAVNSIPIKGEDNGELIDINRVYEISRRQTREGVFLDRAYSEFSQNTGFHFAPAIDLNEAVFWNSSAMMLAVDSQVSFHTDWRRYGRSGALFRLNGWLAGGAGFYFSRQDENRTAQLSPNSTPITDSFRCDEWAANISIAIKPFKNFYIGVSPKLIYQRIEDPAFIELDTAGAASSFIKETTSLNYFDLDISSTFRPASFLKIGVSFMNIRGTELRTNDNGKKNLKSIGIGVSSQLSRFILGGEIWIKEGENNFSFGLRYVPLKFALIRLGWSPIDEMYSIGLSYKNIFLSYNHNTERRGYFLIGTRLIF